MMIMELRDLVCRFSDDRLQADRSQISGNWDLDNQDRPQPERRSDYLTLLATCKAVADALDGIVFTACSGALRNGANFGEIGKAQGVSRQAARQYWRRHTEERTVTLKGGPRDGQRARSFGGGDIVFSISDSSLDLYEIEDEESTTAHYRKKSGNPDVYEFHHFEDHNGRVLAEVDNRIRLHRLSVKWGIDSRILLIHARKVDPGVRSVSSRVSRDTLEKLHEIIFGSS